MLCHKICVLKYLSTQLLKQRKHNCTITNLNWSTLFKKIIAVYSQNNMKHTQENEVINCRVDTGLLKVKHFSFKILYVYLLIIYEITSATYHYFAENVNTSFFQQRHLT
jgi:hypothetical protein